MGVYEPSDDTFLMMENISPTGKCLEVGCGSGLVSVYMAGCGCDVMACDINPSALRCMEKNAAINHCEVKTVESDLFENISGKFDTIVFNPPYLPSEDQVPGAEQWNGGKEGFETTEKFLAQCPEHLNDGGRIFIILSSLTDIESFIRKREEFTFTKLGEKKFFFESIYCYEIQIKN